MLFRRPNGHKVAKSRTPLLYSIIVFLVHPWSCNFFPPPHSSSHWLTVFLSMPAGHRCTVPPAATTWPWFDFWWSTARAYSPRRCPTRRRRRRSARRTKKVSTGVPSFFTVSKPKYCYLRVFALVYTNTRCVCTRRNVFSEIVSRIRGRTYTIFVQQ